MYMYFLKYSKGGLHRNIHLENMHSIGNDSLDYKILQMKAFLGSGDYRLICTLCQALFLP